MHINESLYSNSSKSWAPDEVRLLSLWKPSEESLAPEPEDENLSPEELLDDVREEIKQNQKFAMFCVIPGISPELSNIKKMTARAGISPELARYFSRRLLRAGLWTIEGSRIVPNFTYLDLGDLSVNDHLSLTVSILTQLSEEKPSAFETISMATTRPLIRSFIGKVNQALRELTEKSREETQRTCVYSWSHTGVVDFEFTNHLEKDEYL